MKIGNLRDYLSSISTTIASNGGNDKTKNPFDQLKSYIGNKNNIDYITVSDAHGTAETMPYNGEEEIELFGMFGPLLEVSLYFKEGIQLIFDGTDFTFAYKKDNKAIGIFFDSDNSKITCVSEDDSDYGWEITFIVQDDDA